MIEFNITDLTNLYFSGYRYIIVQNRMDHLVLKPLTKKAPEELLAIMRFQQLPILDKRIIELAENVNGIPAYLPEQIFESDYKEYVIA